MLPKKSFVFKHIEILFSFHHEAESPEQQFIILSVYPTHLTSELSLRKPGYREEMHDFWQSDDDLPMRLPSLTHLYNRPGSSCSK